MAKYDGQITEAKNLLPNAKNILIALPVNSNIDKFASGLALFLSLKSQGKNVSIVCDDTVLVAQAHLFGIDNVQKALPAGEGGNYVVTLEGVAVPDPGSPTGWKVPALANLDWYGENNNLNLVFHVVPGETFQPTNVVPHTQGSGFNLIFTIGASDLNNLGSVYAQNSKSFSGVHTFNIDNQAGNTSFGQTNVLDTSASSVSEIMSDLIPSLGLPFEGDTASNLLVGIFDVTANLSGPNIGPDTFMAVANCLRVGGKRPGETVTTQPPVNQPQPVTQPITPVQQPALDLSALTPRQPVEPQIQTAPVVPSTEPNFVNPPVVPTSPTPSVQTSVPEQVIGEGIASELEAEPDWLTPKVFKGGSVG